MPFEGGIYNLQLISAMHPAESGLVHKTLLSSWHAKL